MRARTKSFGVIGAAAGLVLAAGAVAGPPASAATVGCSYFKGSSVTANAVPFTAALTAGDTITAKASPSTTGDKVIVSYSIGFNIFIKDADASTGVVFTAPATATYNLGYSFEAAGVRPTSLTYSFTATCSSTTVAPAPTVTTTPKPKGKR